MERYNFTDPLPHNYEIEFFMHTPQINYTSCIGKEPT